MAPEPFRGRKGVHLCQKPHCISCLALRLLVTSPPQPSHVLQDSWPSLQWLLPNCTVCPPVTYIVHGRNRALVQIVARFFSVTGGIFKGDFGWFSLHLEVYGAVYSSTFYYYWKHLWSWALLHSTRNLRGNQVQQKTRNPGFFSLSRTAFYHISTRFDLRSWLFHQNRQRAEKHLLTCHCALTKGKKTDLEVERKQAICSGGHKVSRNDTWKKSVALDQS